MALANYLDKLWNADILVLGKRFEQQNHSLKAMSAQAVPLTIHNIPKEPAVKFVTRVLQHNLKSLAEFHQLGGGVSDKASEVVLAVKFEEGLESGQASKSEDRLDLVDLGSLTLEDKLVLLVGRAKSQLLRRDGEIPGVAEVVLSLNRERAGQRRR